MQQPYRPSATGIDQQSCPANTIKSQAISIYRKLGASSCNQAVARSRELGLLEG